MKSNAKKKIGQTIKQFFFFQDSNPKPTSHKDFPISRIKTFPRNHNEMSIKLIEFKKFLT